MKRKLLTNAIVLLITPVFSLTYLFLIPLARVQFTFAQDINEPTSAQPPHIQRTVTKLYIPTGASSTILKESNGETALLIQDHLTSTRVVETSGESKVQNYYPYGMTNGVPNTVSDKQFTSHRSLADTGVYHAGARFYSPELGVFTSADKVQGPNRYMYAAANPTIYTDPSGKIIPLIIAAIIIGGAAFGAGFGTGYEQQSQINQYGSVKEPAKVVVAGVTGGAVGAGVGYMGAVAIPAAIGAVSTGAGAAGAVGLVGGAQIGVGTCMTNPACIDAVEMGAQISSGADLPPGYSANMTPVGSRVKAPTGEMFHDWRQPSRVADELIEGLGALDDPAMGGVHTIDLLARIRKLPRVPSSDVKEFTPDMLQEISLRARSADNAPDLDSMCSFEGVCRNFAPISTAAARRGMQNGGTATPIHFYSEKYGAWHLATLLAGRTVGDSVFDPFNGVYSPVGQYFTENFPDASNIRTFNDATGEWTPFNTGN